MQEILNAFGIDWRLLTINLVNFGLLLLALWYFLYTPLLRMLDERRKKIEGGIHNAELAEHKLSSIEASRNEKLSAAAKEADEVLANARTAGSAKEQALAKQGEAAAARLLKEAEAQAEEMKRHAIEESKEEVAKLIVLGMERTMKKQ